MSLAGRVVWQNSASRALAGNHVGLPPPPGQPQLDEAIERVASGREEHAVIAGALSDVTGRLVVVDSTLAPLRSSGEIVGLIGLHRRPPRPVRPSEHVSLTARQYEVLLMLAEGLSTEEIAERLVLATETVRNHVRAILSECGVTSRLAAVAHAYRSGLLPPPAA
jgi:DNA-binding NarL/FixJ family response regulator